MTVPTTRTALKQCFKKGPFGIECDKQMLTITQEKFEKESKKFNGSPILFFTIPDLLNETKLYQAKPAAEKEKTQNLLHKSDKELICQELTRVSKPFSKDSIWGYSEKAKTAFMEHDEKDTLTQIKLHLESHSFKVKQGVNPQKNKKPVLYVLAPDAALLQKVPEMKMNTALFKKPS